MLTIADHTSVEPLIMDRDPWYFMGVGISHSGTLNTQQTLTSGHKTQMKRDANLYFCPLPLDIVMIPVNKGNHTLGHVYLESEEMYVLRFAVSQGNL